MKKKEADLPDLSEISCENINVSDIRKIRFPYFFTVKLSINPFGRKSYAPPMLLPS
jgi:hypothetical protein